MPADTATAPVSPETCTGADRCIVVPSPSWPLLFHPHAQTVPSPLSATVWPPPAYTAITPVSPDTCTGVSRSVVVPSPSWPEKLPPHAQPVPSPLSATV